MCSSAHIVTLKDLNQHMTRPTEMFWQVNILRLCSDSAGGNTQCTLCIDCTQWTVLLWTNPSNWWLLPCILLLHTHCVSVLLLQKWNAFGSYVDQSHTINSTDLYLEYHHDIVYYSLSLQLLLPLPLWALHKLRLSLSPACPFGKQQASGQWSMFMCACCLRVVCSV